MKKEILDALTAKTRELMEAPTCSVETRATAQRWLEAVGTESERSETEIYLKELEENNMPIDQLIRFAGSAQGIEYFGADAAANIVAHTEKIKKSGTTYCDCPACAAVGEILAKKAEIPE